ncbi:hypothetical protein [Streptomyces sp. NPDC126499]|uniref:hypothetical protein n=1 Tax=Streptomyces sp. NPDC126499 TaxID=3155314 RepID=UPI00331C78FA
MHVGRERHRRTRAAGALAHLLLVVVLALGVFMMHSTGHPEGSPGGDTTTGGSGAHHSASLASGAHDTGVRDAGTHASGAHDAVGAGRASHEPAALGAAPHGPSSHDSGGTGMNMTTLCVAVLGGVWLIAALVRAALVRRTVRVDELPARLLAALGPNAPPPRPPDLARLSVLRI